MPHSSDCLMLAIESQSFLEDLNFLDPNDIDELEKEFHCTIIYGLVPGGYPIQDFINHVKGKMPEYLTVKGLSFFNNETDVLKLDIELTPELIELRNIVTNYNNEEKYPNYIPHVTLAYLKKGSASKYLNREIEFEIKLPTKYFILSFANEKKVLFL